MKPKDIASKLRVHISTVYNELHRGEYQRLVGDTWELVSAYSPDIAEQKYQAHLRDKGPALKIVPTEKRPATPFGEAPFDRIAEKWDVDSYELRYLARVYEALLKNAQTTVLEDRYFSHRDQITSEGTRARPELTVNIKTT
jgi:hypothetical protein